MIPQCKNASLQSIRREVDLAWLAGIYDGEGSFQLFFKSNMNGAKYLDIKIRVYNTDIRMIQKIAEIYINENIVFCYALGNNGVKKNNNWKRQIGIQISSYGSCKKMLEIVLPYMINKKECGEIVLEAINYRKTLPHNKSRLGRMNLENDPQLKIITEKFENARKFYIDPSEATRRAGESLSW